MSDSDATGGDMSPLALDIFPVGLSCYTTIQTIDKQVSEQQIGCTSSVCISLGRLPCWFHHQSLLLLHIYADLQIKALKPAQSILLSLGLTQVWTCGSNFTPNRTMWTWLSDLGKFDVAEFSQTVMLTFISKVLYWQIKGLYANTKMQTVRIKAKQWKAKLR